MLNIYEVAPPFKTVGSAESLIPEVLERSLIFSNALILDNVFSVPELKFLPLQSRYNKRIPIISQNLY